MIARRSLATRLVVALLLLLLAFGLFVAFVSRQAIARHDDEVLQRVSEGLALHIVRNWPVIEAYDRNAAEREERNAVMMMLMAVNPGVQVYVLAPDGRVAAYIGEPGMVQEHQVDLAPIRRFLGGHALPIRATDPMGSGIPRLFSAARFPPREPGEAQRGYLYVVLDGGPRDNVAAELGDGRAFAAAAAATGAGMLVIMLIGGLLFRRMSRPLGALVGEMRAYSAQDGPAEPSESTGDEVETIAQAFRGMTGRIEVQAERERALTRAHREAMAGIAHDLRTPLTALHGHLEALDGPAATQGAMQERLLGAALAQSDKVRRLSQQLFELTALQSADELVQREPFRLDELVSDTVQKFALTGGVNLVGVPPGPVELVGDFGLVERALTNLIDNALRHGPGSDPVQVSLQRAPGAAEIRVSDTGPGLPAEIAGRLERGQSVRNPPIARASGGIGGLGLAIAQRVAELHGGSLRPVKVAAGTMLCLALALPS